MKFTNDYITEQIKTRIPILDIADEFGVKMRKAGRSYKGLCPFHSEKTPSFSIDTRKNIFHCFGCHKKGDNIYFYSLLKGIENGQAWRELANRLGLSVNRELSEKEKIEVIQASKRHDDRKLERKFADKCRRLFFSLCDIRDSMREQAKVHTEIEQVEQDYLLIRYYHEKAVHQELIDRLSEGLFEEIEFRLLVDYYKQAKGVVEQWQKIEQKYSEN